MQFLFTSYNMADVDWLPRRFNTSIHSVTIREPVKNKSSTGK